MTMTKLSTNCGLNLIKTIMESPHKDVDTCKISFLFKEPLKIYGTQTKLIEPILQNYHKDILLSKISLLHPRPFKSDGLLNC